MPPLKDPTFFDDVGEFHRKFRLPVTDVFVKCGEMTKSEEDFRLKFLDEEMEELRLAIVERNVAKQLDALVDIAWVAMGTAHYLGAPFNEAWAEVRRANMEKVRMNVDPDKPYRNIGAVVKPVGWRPPDIDGVIKKHNRA